MNEYLFPLFVLGSLLLTIFSVVLAFFLIVQSRRQKNYQLEKQAMELAHQHALLSTRLEVQEQSMNLVSEELHDNVGQLLNLSMIQLNALEESPGEPSLIGKTRQPLEKALTIVRNLSHSLNSNLINENGLVSSIQSEVDQLLFPDFRATLHTEGKPFKFSREQELLIFRIIQETIQNVIKHAGASSMEIHLRFDEHSCDLQITDDGVGFSPELALKNKSLGLRNIMNRAKLLNAEINISSAPGAGTSFHLAIPKSIANGR